MLLNEQIKRLTELEKSGTREDMAEVNEIKTMALSIRHGVTDNAPSFGGAYAIETTLLSRDLTQVVTRADALLKKLNALPKSETP